MYQSVEENENENENQAQSLLPLSPLPQGAATVASGAIHYRQVIKSPSFLVLLLAFIIYVALSVVGYTIQTNRINELEKKHEAWMLMTNDKFQNILDEHHNLVDRVVSDNKTSSKRMSTIVDELTSHQAALVRFSNMTSNADVLDKLKDTTHHVEDMFLKQEEEIDIQLSENLERMDEKRCVRVFVCISYNPYTSYTTHTLTYTIIH